VFARIRLMRKVRTSAVISAGVMLLGVLTIAYGYFQNARFVLYAGLCIALAGVLGGVLRIVVHGKA
jgi:hypothetical protein